MNGKFSAKTFLKEFFITPKRRKSWKLPWRLKNVYLHAMRKNFCTKKNEEQYNEILTIVFLIFPNFFYREKKTIVSNCEDIACQYDCRKKNYDTISSEIIFLFIIICQVVIDVSKEGLYRITKTDPDRFRIYFQQCFKQCVNYY